MSFPDYLTRHYLSPLKALWKLCRACLTSRALACCVLWSTAILYASTQVSLDIQDARDFIGRGVLVIYPFRYAKAATSSVWGRTDFVHIGQ